MTRKVKAERNVPNWQCTDTDYVLVFCQVDGKWCECGHNLKQFSDMLLSDYLNFIGIQIPDYTQYLRIYDHERNMHFVYHWHGGRIRIDVKPFVY